MEAASKNSSEQSKPNQPTKEAEQVAKASGDADQPLATITSNDPQSLHREIQILRDEINREKREREKEVKYLKNAVSVLDQRSGVESKARYTLAEHVKFNVEAVCAECAKQQDSIKNLWGSVRMLSIMLTKDRECLMEAERLTEKVHSECQEHDRVTEGLLDTLQGAAKVFSFDKSPEDAMALAFDSPPEHAHNKTDIEEHMAELSKRTRQQLEAVLPKYRMQLITTQELLNSITSLKTIFEKEQLEKIIKSQGLDEAFQSFRALVSVKSSEDAEGDSADGKGNSGTGKAADDKGVSRTAKGLESVMNALNEASKSSKFESAEQAKEWLAGVRGNLEKACEECKSQKQATSQLFHAIVGAKNSLQEQLQKRIRAQGGMSWGEEPRRRAKQRVAIEDYVPDGNEVYQADNTLLKALTPGLGFRVTPNIQDMDKENLLVPWGSLVSGISHDANWLKVGDRFLPKALKGMVVLRPWQPPPRGNLGTAPSTEASSPKKASMAPDLQTIDESLSREGSQVLSREGSGDGNTAEVKNAGAPQPTAPTTASAEDKDQPQSQPQGGPQSLGPEAQQTSMVTCIDAEEQEVQDYHMASDHEIHDLVSHTVRNAVAALQDQLEHEAQQMILMLKNETSSDLQSTLKGEIERIQLQMPQEIKECFTKNMSKIVEQVKSLPLQFDNKADLHIQEVAHRVYSERIAELGLKPEKVKKYDNLGPVPLWV